jgi:hypothetical protein
VRRLVKLWNFGVIARKELVLVTQYSVVNQVVNAEIATHPLARSGFDFAPLHLRL